MTDDVARALRQLRKGTAACKLESPTLDVKAPSGNPKATFTNIVEAVVCFANSAGGTVVLGIADDKPWPDALVGTGMSSETLREERRGDDWPARSARAGGTEVVDATALARARELLARVPSGGVATLARYGGLDDS